MQPSDTPRALRRHHRARLKKARQTYWGYGRGLDYIPPISARQLGMLVATPAICSCPMCGNARKWQGERTIQERRWLQDDSWDCAVQPESDDSPGT